MRRELRKEMVCVLEECINSELKGVTLAFGVSALRLEAINLLSSEGAISSSSPGYFRITGSGYDYYEKLKARKVYWLKENGFRIATIVAIVLAAVIGSLILVFLG